MAGDSAVNTSAAQRGIVFFAHGSRDPLWRKPIEAVAQQLRVQYADALCATAYLELTTPDLPTAARMLIEQGCRHLTVLPMFLGTGRHAREDLPKLVASLEQLHPHVQFEIATAVGEDPRITQRMAEIAAEHLHKTPHL